MAVVLVGVFHLHKCRCWGLPYPSVCFGSLHMCVFISQVEWQPPEWVGSRGACGRGQLELKGFPFGCAFHEGMSLLPPPPPAPYSGFHPHTQHVTRAINNSTSFETLPPTFGSLLGKQRCLHSDITWCEVLTGTGCHQVCLCAYLSVVFKQQSWKSWRAVCYHFVRK